MYALKPGGIYGFFAFCNTQKTREIEKGEESIEMGTGHDIGQVLPAVLIFVMFCFD